MGDFHAIIAGYALPNDASVGLHEKFGFTKVAHFPQVAANSKDGSMSEIGR